MKKRDEVALSVCVSVIFLYSFYFNIQKDLFQVTLMSHKLPGLHSFVSLADTLLAGLLTGERLDKQTHK